jgi:hypothetical protein
VALISMANIFAGGLVTTEHIRRQSYQHESQILGEKG